MENGHIVSEECAPYMGKTAGQQCSNYKDCPALARIKSSRYVGGYNYLPSEKLI